MSTFRRNPAFEQRPLQAPCVIGQSFIADPVRATADRRFVTHLRTFQTCGAEELVRAGASPYAALTQRAFSPLPPGVNNGRGRYSLVKARHVVGLEDDKPTGAKTGHRRTQQRHRITYVSQHEAANHRVEYASDLDGSRVTLDEGDVGPTQGLGASPGDVQDGAVQVDANDFASRPNQLSCK
jgi:hypothetical protein